MCQPERPFTWTPRISAEEYAFSGESRSVPLARFLAAGPAAVDHIVQRIPELLGVADIATGEDHAHHLEAGLVLDGAFKIGVRQQMTKGAEGVRYGRHVMLSLSGGDDERAPASAICP